MYFLKDLKMNKYNLVYLRKYWNVLGKILFFVFLIFKFGIFVSNFCDFDR